jgi:cytochrome c oxidase subunit 4
MENSEHAPGYKIYMLVFVTLLLLTLLTIDVAFFNAGWLSLPLALLIASVKAALVVLYFMHVRFSEKLTWIVVAGGFLWLAILLALTLSDYLSRDWIASP